MLSEKETIWIPCLICDAGFKNHDTTPINSDNQSAIKLATSDKIPSTTAKHIDVQVHFILDLHQDRILGVLYTEGEHNDADIFQNPLDSTKHKKLVEGLD